MTDIQIKKGLDIPIKGSPAQYIEQIPPSACLCFDLSQHSSYVNLRLLKKEGDEINQGEPLVQDKDHEDNVYLSPFSGRIKEIRRGEKRKLQSIIIEQNPDQMAGKKIDPPKENIIDWLQKSGMLMHIRKRPCDAVADPARLPKSIFIKAIESAPFTPSADQQIEGMEQVFQQGVDLLAKIAPVHLIYSEINSCKAFSETKNAKTYSAKGPHPIANPSLHIQKIDPIRSSDEIVWTLNAWDVLCIGSALQQNPFHPTRIISIAGEMIKEDKRGYYRVTTGTSIAKLLEGKLIDGPSRLIAGDPLMGHEVTQEDFLGLHDFCLCALVETEKREPFHFFRIGRKKYTASKAYLSGFLSQKSVPFTTALHGETRAFVDPNVYDKVMPLKIPTSLLVKAVMIEDFDDALELGLLEVAAEDFALPTFLCPSKIEMVQIMQKGLQTYAKEIFS